MRMEIINGEFLKTPNERRANMTTERVIEILADIKDYYGERLDGRVYFGFEILPLNDNEREAIDKAIEILESLKSLKGEAE